MTAIGIAATLVVALLVVLVLWLTGGPKAVSDNATAIGGLILSGAVFSNQLVNTALGYRYTRQAHELEDRRAQEEHVLADRRAQDEALQAYLDQIGTLLLDKDRPLRKSKEGAEVRILARVRTLTVLARLDGSRKAQLVQFLYESDLIAAGRSVLDLRGAALRLSLIHI